MIALSTPALCAALLLGLLVSPRDVRASDAEAPQRVLYINSYHHGYPWSDEVERGLREQLAASGRNIELSVEYLDSQRFDYLHHQDALIASMAIKYADFHQDVILTSDNAAFDFAVRHRERLAPGRPIVFCGYNNLRPADLVGIPAITGVNEELDILGTMELALSLHPETRTLDVLTPWANGMDVTRRLSDTWLIDYGNKLSEADVALYEAPFEHVTQYVKAERERQRDEKRKCYWWRLGRSGAEIRTALAPLTRYIATPMVAKHRLFVWLDRRVFPDQQLIVIAHADDTTFGILHSRFHELWSLRMGTSLEDRPRYTPTTTFETFPFPTGLTPADTNHGTETLDSGAIIPKVAPDRRAVAVKIAEAAHRLDTLRENWLNPPEWVERLPEVVPGYPDRMIPKPEHAAELKKRTLTNLYNQRPAWLVNAHRAIDCAVAEAYGWTDDTPELPEAEILRRLLALNLSAASPSVGTCVHRPPSAPT